jgi:hypothetical protein
MRAQLCLVQELIGRRHFSQIQEQSKTPTPAHAAILYEHIVACRSGLEMFALCRINPETRSKSIICGENRGIGANLNRQSRRPKTEPPDAFGENLPRPGPEKCRLMQLLLVNQRSSSGRCPRSRFKILVHPDCPKELGKLIAQLVFADQRPKSIKVKLAPKVFKDIGKSE